jgi:hypothetical protein
MVHNLVRFTLKGLRFGLSGNGVDQIRQNFTLALLKIINLRGENLEVGN